MKRIEIVLKGINGILAAKKQQGHFIYSAFSLVLAFF